MSFDRDRDRHLAWEELISASVSGDITLEEQAQLDAHLAGCAACRATADAFASQRHLVTNLRQIAPPRDLGARVRTLVEQEERRMVPWWRRPPAIFAGLSGGLAVVAGALLAVVLLETPSQDPVAGASPTPQPSVSIVASGSPPPAVTPIPSAGPTAPVLPTPGPSGVAETVAPQPTPEGTPVPPDPDGYVAVVGPLESPQLSVVSGTSAATEPITDPTGGDPAALVGVPTDAELAPGGEWVAMVAEQGQSGLSDVRVTRTDALASDEDLGTVEPDPDVAVGTTLPVEQTIAGNPFVERMVWSPDGRWLATTIHDPADGRVDAWVFDATDGSAERLTNTGNAFAASFAFPSEDAEADAPARLWVSLAGEEPRSHLVTLPAADEPIEPLTEGELGDTTIDAFLPIVSPNGTFVIYWEGRMANTEEGWQLTEGGRPMLGAFADGGEALVEGVSRPLFRDLEVGADELGFTSASIAWSPNGDAYALWDVAYAGNAGEAGESYPDVRDVYFGRALDPQGLRRDSAIARDLLPPDTEVVDVKVGPSGRHLLVTVRYRTEGDLAEPRADLVLVERSGGDAEDQAEIISPEDEEGWYGPAVFDEAAWRALLEE